MQFSEECKKVPWFYVVLQRLQIVVRPTIIPCVRKKVFGTVAVSSLCFMEKEVRSFYKLLSDLHGCIIWEWAIAYQLLDDLVVYKLSIECNYRVNIQKGVLCISAKECFLQFLSKDLSLCHFLYFKQKKYCSKRILSGNSMHCRGGGVCHR